MFCLQRRFREKYFLYILMPSIEYQKTLKAKMLAKQLNSIIFVDSE